MIKNLKIIPSVISVTMLLICLIDGLPYCYFNVLRWVICGTSIFYIVQFKNDHKILYWLFICIAILFNPVISIHLNKNLWLFIDLLCVIPMIIAGFKLKNLD